MMIQTSSVATMRSAVISMPRREVISDRIPVPEPSPTQVRIHMDGCGICGSNLPLWEGRTWFAYPLEPGAPGHEGWGTVDAVDPAAGAASQLAVGDRVAALSYHAFAEYDVADVQHVVKLPAELDGQPFPGEALGCAMNVMRRSDVAADQFVAIVGIGFLGALLTQLAVAAGARVIAISRRPFALCMAKKIGAIETLQLDDLQHIESRIQQLTRGRGCACTIEATGCQQALDVASQITAVRGRLVIAGYHQDGPRQINLQQWNWKGLDVINAHERDAGKYVQGMRDAVEAVVAQIIDPTPLYTHTFSLDEIGKAFATAERRPDGFLKALVQP